MRSGACSMRFMDARPLQQPDDQFNESCLLKQKGPALSWAFLFL
jgi:hypothetical protein